jgi:hypothetical protein
MTPEQTREQAIEAALNKFKAVVNGLGEFYSMRAAIDAYEKAMWRPISDYAMDGSMVLLTDGKLVWYGSGAEGSLNCSDEGEYGMGFGGRSLTHGPNGWGQTATHFRPLPSLQR